MWQWLWRLTRCSEEEVISTAVLRELQKTLHHYSDVSMWISPQTKESLDKEQAEINRIREWLATTEMHPYVRSEYNGWLSDYFQHGLNEAYQELKTGAHKRDMDAYTRARDEHERKLNNLLGKNPIPVPPRD
jgi:uncharacterized protein (DUF2342 family)